MCSGFARRFAACCLVATAVVCAATAAFAEEHSRLFGVLPNYTTVDEPSAGGVPSAEAPAISRAHSFKIAAQSSFDPVVFPYVGLVTALGGNQNYRERYMQSFADNSIGNFMTTAVVPSLTNQDARYFRSREGGLIRRVAYAASRSVVTRKRSCGSAFNVSEIGGNLAAAGLSNLYYSDGDRTVAGTMSRWGSQVMWDTVANELKEFWPDIRSKLHKH
jgi:hypothetical protein